MIEIMLKLKNKYLHSLVVLCCLLLLPLHALGKYGEVRSVLQFEEHRAGVTPASSAGVEQESVVAKGIARIYGGDLRGAKKRALLDAYKNAISQKLPIHISSSFRMENYSQLYSNCVAQSDGYIKEYTILKEGILQDNRDYYEVIIDAGVAPGSMKNNEDIAALKLFSQTIGNPKVLLLLQGAEGTRAEPGFAGFNLENELYNRLKQLGFSPVMVDQESLTTRQDELKLARQGYANPAIAVGRRSGADIVVVGMLNMQLQEAKAYGATLYQAVSTVSTRLIHVPGAELFNTDSKRFIASHQNRLVLTSNSYKGCLDYLAKSITWVIPQYYGKAEEKISLTFSGTTSSDPGKLNQFLTTLEGVNSVIDKGWSLQQHSATGTYQATLNITPGIISGDEIAKHLIAENRHYGIKAIRPGQIDFFKKGRKE